MTAPQSSFEEFEKELAVLVARFSKNLSHYKGPDYNEASLRQDFLNPLFSALGWDISNRAGLIQSKREVEVESATRIGSAKKRADYLFRANGRDRFVCEAKKPREELHKGHIFQAKRYAWNKDLPFAVLTDFEETKFYIVGARPDSEQPAVGELKALHFSKYEENARLLWNHLSRESIGAGFIDRLIDELPKKAAGKGRMRQGYLIKPDRNRALDADFLNFLDEARKELASSLVKHNDRETLLADGTLNAATQKILDRILFLRICEDRDIDTGIKLQSLVDTWEKHTARPLPERRSLIREDPPPSGPRPPGESLYRCIVRHFRELDRRPPTNVPYFNGQLFKKDPSEDLEVGDDFLVNFIRDLSDENSPYLFNVIPVEILGSVYERFLGKVVRLHGRGVTIEEKPEVRKAGGVYYTPRYIVDYIVEQTVGKLLDDAATAKDLKPFTTRTEALRFLDPACGSGSFLIRAFERTCEHWEKRLTDDLPSKDDKTERTAWEKKHRRLCWVDPETDAVHLTVDLKRHILTSNIYGVDLDAAAVEVTQLSLYLKMLEGENRTTLKSQRELLPDENNMALLPPLQDNIKCGNSLIASDFSLDPEDLVRVHAFDWPVQFRDIMKAGGFDAVIGNPPYIRIQGFPEDQVAYFVGAYRAATGNYDIYVNFVERGLNLLSKTGRLGMILPNKFFRTDYGQGLRTVLSETSAVAEIVDFGADQVFEATTYTCLLFLNRSGSQSLNYAVSKADEQVLKSLAFEQRLVASLASGSWTFADERQTRLLEKLNTTSVRLLDLPADMSRGSSSGDDEVFMVESNGHTLENDGLRTPLFASDFGRYYFEPEDKWRIIFPYVAEKDGFRLLKGSELEDRFPKMFQHLQSNAARLKERKQFREWFGYSAPRNLQLHDRAQIAVPLLADGGLFALIPKASRGKMCPMASGGFTITLGEGCDLTPEFVLGVLNSRLSFWFLRQISNVFRGGWITCTKQYFGELPIVRLDLNRASDKSRHDKLVSLVDKMLVLMPKLRAAKSESEKSTLQNAVAATDQQIDALVYELYGLTEEEVQIVESAIQR